MMSVFDGRRHVKLWHPLQIHVYVPSERLALQSNQTVLLIGVSTAKSRDGLEQGVKAI